MASKGFAASRIPLDTREGKLTLLAILIMFYTMAMFISVIVHEILGHGLATELVGGDFYAVYVSPGSGYASLYFPDSVSAASRAFVLLAGILVEIITGLILLFIVFRRLKNFMLRLFTLVLSVSFLVYPSMYLLLGFFYRSGDTYKAASALGMLQEGDAFIVTGLILSGLFVLLVSMVALNFLGRYMNMTDEVTRYKLLGLFWFPPIMLSTTSIIAALVMNNLSISYPVANAGTLLLFISVAIFMVPQIVEPDTNRKAHNISFRAVISVLLSFVLILSAWIGIFGPSDSSAHGLLLKNPPVEVEPYYSNYSIGNVEIMIYENGTARLSFGLRNHMDPHLSSPLDRKIHQTFTERPYWGYYVNRSRYLAILMFDLPREVSQNLSFSTDFGTMWALGEEHEYGRVCTTYVRLELGEPFQDSGVRQPGGSHGPEFIYHPGDVEPTLRFDDPWVARSQYSGNQGFLDEVRISWGHNLSLDKYEASNEFHAPIYYNEGNETLNSIAWRNSDFEYAPLTYKFSLLRVPETGEEQHRTS